MLLRWFLGLVFATLLSNPSTPSRFPSSPRRFSSPRCYSCWKFVAVDSEARKTKEKMIKNPTKTLASMAAAFFVFFLAQPLLLSAQSLHSDPIFSSPPPLGHQSSPASIASAARLRRIAAGVLLGSFTGFALSLAALFAVHLAFLLAAYSSALTGPVVFSQHLRAKKLRAALAAAGDPPALHPLGRGAHGASYKLVLDGGLTVAVKRLDAQPPSSKPLRREHRQLEALARAKHPNVMSLWAYARDAGGQLCLVYGYAPGGSLEDAMKRVRAQQMTLSWDARRRIAVGVARGLRHLHFECVPRILHCGLKPSNVILDAGFEPKLVDSGVARLTAAAPAANSAVLRSASYTAPECLQSNRYTDKSDVYSFGMILAVLVTGRDPMDTFPSVAGESFRGSGCGGMAQWLRQMQLAENGKEALDAGTIGDEGDEEEMTTVMRVALVCLSDLPSDRPSSDELVAMLTQLHSL